MSEDDQAVAIHGRTLIIERFEPRISGATWTTTGLFIRACMALWFPRFSSLFSYLGRSCPLRCDKAKRTRHWSHRRGVFAMPFSSGHVLAQGLPSERLRSLHEPLAPHARGSTQAR